MIQPKQGPRCSECPLFLAGVVVHDTIPAAAQWSGVVIVGEMPGYMEVKNRRPFVGPSGRLLQSAARLTGTTLDGTWITNCIRCGLQGGAKPTEAAARDAADCCRPLLMANLHELKPQVVLAVGAIPWLSLTGLKGIDRWRGTVQPPIDEEPWYLMATLHPAGLLHAESRRILVELLAADVARAHRLAAGAERVWEPDICDPRNVDELIGFLGSIPADQPVAVDVETDGIDSLTCNLLTVGVATIPQGMWALEALGGEYRPIAYSIPWPAAPVEGLADYYPTDDDKRKVLLAVRRLFENHTLVFHNKSFDVPVLRRHVATSPWTSACHDTLLMHHACYPKLPHTLEQVASQFLTIEPWKSDYWASEAAESTDESTEAADESADETTPEAVGTRHVPDTSTEKAIGELLWYNAMDAAATVQLYHELRRELREHGVEQVYERDRQLLDESIRWHAAGIRIDLAAAEILEVDYAVRMSEGRQALRSLCGFPPHAEVEAARTSARDDVVRLSNECRRKGMDPAEKAVLVVQRDAAKVTLKAAKKAISDAEFNPGSPVQIRQVLFARNLTPSGVTKKTYQPSTSYESLWDLRGDAFVDALFTWRDAAKIHSTYLKPLPGKVDAEGRIHPVWKLHSTPSGRFGTAPAVQNWPKDMKRLMIPADGHVLVGADYSALELRVVALLSGEEEWIQTFAEGKDLHAMMAYRYFPDSFPKWDGLWLASADNDDERDKLVPERPALRKAGKSITFGDIYLAGADTLARNIRLDRPDVRTEKDWQKLKREVEVMQRRLRAATPNRMAWADLQRQLAEKNFYLRSAEWTDQYGVSHGGRLRKWPLGEVSPNEAVNHCVQSGAADIVNGATLRLADRLRQEGLDDRVRMILQVHDFICLEVDERRGLVADVKELLRATMETVISYRSPVTGMTNTMTFPATPKAGFNVADLS